MSFQIRYDAPNRVVRAIFFDEVTIEEKMASARQIAEKYGHLHPLLLVVDVREAKVLLDMQQRQEFGVYAATLPGLSHAHIAVLHAPDHNANVGIDQAATAKGLRVVEFLTEHAALEWLASRES
ncbi:hypothetical protein [Microbulbifer sp. Q7]|uniref:hypothetical protein n=1 Tax=Microbulbifer sp. Q7 TaxID=1785091 RepID=UPI000832677B|nr:hypothetical protein [Microbulbifer sp. Q7]